MNLFRDEELNRDHVPVRLDFVGHEADILGVMVDFDDGSTNIMKIYYASYQQVYESLVELNLLDRDKDRCICVNDEYIMDLLKDYM